VKISHHAVEDMSGQLLNNILRARYSYLGGYLITNSDSWKPHVECVCGKTMELIGFLNRILCTFSKELSYKQFVLPLLDYASSIWDPYQIIKLEMIQRRAARFVMNQPWKKNVRDSITSLLSSLKWPTLQLCRSVPV